MGYSPSPGSLELSLVSFGPVANAEIELRPLTVFVGPSNSGKSYVAILIYALPMAFCRHSGGRFPIYLGEGLEYIETRTYQADS